MTRLLGALVLFLCACAPKTAILFSVGGPKGKGAVATLELVVAHPSYCERWVTDSTATGQRYDVHNRDLAKSPLGILLVPDHRTALTQPVRALVLARDASDAVIGYAAFGAHAFRFEKVDEYKGAVGLLGEGASAVASDGGCACFSGQPQIGNGSGVGCDERVPPSFARLQDTAGCDLPAGGTLPVNVCDGQLYPGETPNRVVPCYTASNGACVVGTRTCVDQGGVAYGGNCAVSAAPALPSNALCDAFATCAETACSDPLTCTQTEIASHTHLSCTLRLSSSTSNGQVAPCNGNAWRVGLGPQTGAVCTAAMLSGTQVGPMTIGFVADGHDGAQVVSSTCPATIEVTSIAVDDPAKVTAQAFSFSVGDTIYDVEVTPLVGCPSDGVADLRCDKL